MIDADEGYYVPSVLDTVTVVLQNDLHTKSHKQVVFLNESRCGYVGDIYARDKSVVRIKLKAIQPILDLGSTVVKIIKRSG